MEDHIIEALYDAIPEDATRTLTAFTLRNGLVTERYTAELDADGDVTLTCCLDTAVDLPADTFIIPARAVRMIEIALRRARQPVQVVRAQENVVFLGGKP